MAAREVSISRVALKSDDAARTCDSAHRASVDVLFIRQTGANQGQLESSTEFRSKCRLCRRARERNALACHLCFGGRTQTRGSLESSELGAD